jgi:hypothetical protein
MALSREIVEATIAAARENRIEPAALLAVVEIESAGKPFEEDGVTPRFLFEKHKFTKELGERDPFKVSAAKQMGLVRASWGGPGAQYKDQATSAQRLDLLARACRLDEEAALSACSWGLGQVMGSHAEDLGYDSAKDMVETMKRGGAKAQVETMVRFIRKHGLAQAMARRDWRAFAKGYNGSGYEKNRYHTKLADAYARWKQRHPEVAPTTVPKPSALPGEDITELGDQGALVDAYQKRLAELGYAVGTIDGIFGARMRSAVLTFQAENSLTTDGRIGPQTRAALNSPEARPMPVGDRSNTTGDDLAKAGSGTVIDSRTAGTAAKVIVTTSVATGVQESTDVLGKLQSWVGDMTAIQGVVDPLVVLMKWCFQNIWIFAIVAGIIIMRKTNAIERARVLAHQLGRHLGR